MGGKNQDFGSVAEAQGEANREVVRDQLYANRPDQYTPWGYQKWTTETLPDGTEKWSQTQGLTPELQAALNQQIALQGQRSELAYGLGDRMASEYGTPMNYGGLNPYSKTPEAQFTLPEQMQRSMSFDDITQIQDPYGTRQRAEDAVYGQAQSRLAPRFASQRQAMEIKLRNQGIGPEDEAWKTQMGAIDQQETDAYNQAQFSAVGAGRDEAGQMFGQQLSRRQQSVGERQASSQFRNQAAQQAYAQMLGANQQNYQQMMQGSQYGNQLRQAQLAEMMQRRGQGLNEINALLYGQQVGMPQMPSFSQGQAAQPTPVYRGAMDTYNAGQAGTQNWMNMIGGLGGAALGAWGARG